MRESPDLTVIEDRSRYFSLCLLIFSLNSKTLQAR